MMLRRMPLRTLRLHSIAPACLCLVLSGCATTHGAQSSAHLRGVFWFAAPEDIARPLEEWRQELDAVQTLGMDLVVLCGWPVSAPRAAPLAPSATDSGHSERSEESPSSAASNATAHNPAELDSLENLLTETDHRGLTVFLDTGSAPQWWTITDPTDEITRASNRIIALHEKYSRHKSFRGFYIPYELYVFWGQKAKLVQALYCEIAAACKRTAPQCQVMISPFFILDNQKVLGDFRWATPTEYEQFWKETLGPTAINIVALQDSGEHLSCYTMEQRRPFFAAMKAACDATGKQLWANIETGELDVASLDDYVARFGLKTHVNDPKTQPYWRGVPAEKLRAKLALVREFTPTAVTWGYKEFIRPSKSAEAASLYTEYRAVLRPNRG